MHRPLTAADLLPHGPLTRLGRQVFVHETIDSTNAFLLNAAETAGDGAVAWAELQTVGRGRLGRRWEAPRGSSVILSVLLMEPTDSPLLARATVLAALAACEAVEQSTVCTPGVRWPNDLVLAGRKLGGVLAESRPITGAVSSAPLPPREGSGGGSARALVVGVGVNCLQHAGHFRGELASKATSLECESPQPVHREAVARALLARLDHWLAAVVDPAAWPGILTEWRARSGDAGAHVTLEHDGRRYEGTVVEIADDGDLVVELDRGGRRRFASATTARNW